MSASEKLLPPNVPIVDQIAEINGAIRQRKRILTSLAKRPVLQNRIENETAKLRVLEAIKANLEDLQHQQKRKK